LLFLGAVICPKALQQDNWKRLQKPEVQQSSPTLLKSFAAKQLISLGQVLAPIECNEAVSFREEKPMFMFGIILMFSTFFY
jgi:hypothetical protein